MASQDPQSAGELALSLPERIRQDALERVASDWARRDPASAAQWFSKQSDSPGYYMIIGNLMSAWVKQDAEKAIAWASALPDRRASDSAIMVAATTIRESDPVEAMKLASTLKDDAARLESSLGVFLSWIQHDPTEAKAWIAQQPKGDDRDYAIERASFQIQSSDPQAAMQMVVSITDPDRLRQDVTSTFKNGNALIRRRLSNG